MPAVELLVDRECPNVEAARKCLREAFAAAGLPPSWREWRIDDATAPSHVRGYGSPTILVDGVDVGGAESSDGHCCRVYVTEGSVLAGVPDVSRIVEALRTSTGTAM